MAAEYGLRFNTSSGLIEEYPVTQAGQLLVTVENHTSNPIAPGFVVPDEYGGVAYDSQNTYIRSYYWPTEVIGVWGYLPQTLAVGGTGTCILQGIVGDLNPDNFIVPYRGLPGTAWFNNNGTSPPNTAGRVYQIVGTWIGKNRAYFNPKLAIIRA